MEQPTRRTAIKAALTAAGTVATAAFLASTEATTAEAATTLVTKKKTWTFDGHKLPVGWKARSNGTPSTNQVGSYLTKNAVLAHGMLTLRAIIDPKHSGPAAVTKWKHHFSAAIDGPTFEYGTLTMKVREPWAKHPSQQLGKPILMLWPQNDNDAPQDVEADFLETSNYDARHHSAGLNINSGPDWADRSVHSAKVPFDDKWHTYKVIWKPTSFEITRSGKQIFKTTDPSEIPVGPHRIIAQVDFNAVGNAGETKSKTMDAIQIQYAEFEPLTLAKSTLEGPSL